MNHASPNAHVTWRDVIASRNRVRSLKRHEISYPEHSFCILQFSFLLFQLPREVYHSSYTRQLFLERSSGPSFPATESRAVAIRRA